MRLIGLLRQESQILSSDLNSVTQLERCFEMKAIKSAEIILEHIFSQEDQSVYFPYIMKVLPQILNEERSSTIIVQFFSDPTNEGKDISNRCSLEQEIIHPDAPLFSE